MEDLSRASSVGLPEVRGALVALQSLAAGEDLVESASRPVPALARGGRSSPCLCGQAGEGPVVAPASTACRSFCAFLGFACLALSLWCFFDERALLASVVDSARRGFGGVDTAVNVRRSGPEKEAMSRRIAAAITVVGLPALISTHAMAGDTQLVAWGSNQWGQTQIPADSSNIADIGAWIHGFGLRFDGTLVLWGSNGQGQAASQGGTKFSQVATNGLHNVALTQAGAVQAWGYDIYGQTNVPSDLGTIARVGAGDYHSFAIKADGSLVTWGRNDQGQSVAPADLGSVREVNGGYWHSLSVSPAGIIRAWGGNTNDSGATTNQSVVPSAISGVRVAAASAGSFHNLVLREDGTVFAWGDNARGQTTLPAGLSKVVQISAGFLHSAALKQDGTVVCWGDNSSGACSVPSDIGRVAKIVAGYGYTAALTVLESCPFDMDGDGAVGGSDIALVLLDFGPCQ